jgi:hypothetical protein
MRKKKMKNGLDRDCLLSREKGLTLRRGWELEN